MGDVVVAEDPAHGAGVADAGDHRGVVERVGVELAARQQRAQRLQRRLVGDIARGEDAGRLPCRAGRRARARARHAACWCRRCCACRRRPSPGRRSARLHGLDHGRMLAHGEIVVAAPHGDVARRLAVAMQAGARKGADDALQLGEDAIAALVVQAAQMAGEECLVVHWLAVSRAPILVGLACGSRRILVAVAGALIDANRTVSQEIVRRSSGADQGDRSGTARPRAGAGRPASGSGPAGRPSSAASGPRPTARTASPIAQNSEGQRHRDVRLVVGRRRRCRGRRRPAAATAVNSATAQIARVRMRWPVPKGGVPPGRAPSARSRRSCQPLKWPSDLRSASVASNDWRRRPNRSASSVSLMTSGGQIATRSPMLRMNRPRATAWL